MAKSLLFYSETKQEIRKMRVASIFSGCGGGDLGLIGGFEFIEQYYDKLSFDIVYAVDIDKKAVATYNNNFNHPAIVGAIENVKINDIPDHDVLLGGFPCQSFSTVNPTKNPFDERGQLYKYMAKILKHKQPSAFIAENVKGMLTLHKGAIYKKIEKEFSKQGYVIRHALVNAADYGVPQKRQRVVMVGIRKDLGFAYEFPAQTHVQETGWIPIKKVVKKLAISDEKYYFSKRAVEGMKNAKNNMKRGLAQDLNQPSLTLTSHLAKVSLNSRDPVLLVDSKREIYRRFTPAEAAGIQSFPKNFKFVGSDADAYRQIGNAIPPVMMWHIGKALSNQLISNGGPVHKTEEKRDNVKNKIEKHFARKEGVLVSSVK